jgi:ABC-type glycerol-3-phosphate transport system substrate-binding protein
MLSHGGRTRVRRRARLLALLGSAVLLAAACGSGGGGTANVQASADNNLVAMTNPDIMEGLTPQTSAGSNSIASFYTYYHQIWHQKLPHLKITEVQVPDESTEITKTLLGQNAGDPPDLIGLHDTVPELVQRGALTDLTPYFKKAGITPSDFLPAMASYARYDGKWYALPGASNPTSGDLLVIPKYLSAAGVDPNNLPRTWTQLLRESEKVVQFGPGHTLERIGEPVVGASDIYMIDEFCGGPSIWNAKTGYQASSSCVENYFKYEKQLVEAYGGWSTYERFITGDPGPWSCSPKDYVATGKELFDLDAYWTGGQIDHRYNLTWKLSDAPSQNGQLNKGIELTAWMLAIPKGAKDPQAAFDFWLTTFYNYGYLAGPTTNGYTRGSQVQAWNQQLIKAQGRIRSKNGYAGNPISSALQVVASEASISDTSYPRGTFTAQYTTIMTDAWNNIAYNKMSVGQALSHAQQQINSQEHSMAGGVSAN